jgi:uncharacterized RDD family membrane protein YckC
MESTLEYAGFWRRFGAYWIDVLVFLPVIALSFFLSGKSHLFYLYSLIPSALISAAFHVYLVHRYGGTPGKLALDTRIAMRDGSAITLKAAAIRYSVLCVLSFASSLGFALAALKIPDAQYVLLGFRERSLTLQGLAPNWQPIVTVLVNVWIWSEFVTMMLNKKRRAVHDYMAGTVVIKTAP